MQGFMAALQALDSPQLRRITDEAMTGDGLLVEREGRVFFHWNPQLKMKVAMVSQTMDRKTMPASAGNQAWSIITIRACRRISFNSSV